MKRIAVAAATVLAIVAVGWLILTLANFLLLVFAAVVLAVIFDAMTGWICRVTGVPRGVGLALSVMAIVGVFAGSLILFGAQMVAQFDTIRQGIPTAIAGLDSLLDGIGIDASVGELFEQGSSDVSSMMSRAGGYALGIIGGVANFVLVFVGAIFIAADPGVYRRGLVLLMPRRAEAPTAAALDDAARGLRGWMIGQAVSSLVVGLLTWAGLAALGVPASGGLGLIAGLFDVIPMVGPIIAGVPAVLLAFTVSPATALWTILLFLAIQQLQGNFLQPMIQKHAVDVPPALLLFAVVAAGTLFGSLGVLLAAPLTVVIFVAVQRIYVRTLLDKPIEIAGGDG